MLLPYRAMACNNAWANRRLPGACLSLTQDAFTAARAGYFPSLHAMLNHILRVDRSCLAALAGAEPPADADHATVPALQAAQEETDQRLIALVDALDASGLACIVTVRRAAGLQPERTDRLLLHLFGHQIHHRGQAHAMLSATPPPPPQLDEFFLAGDATLRAEDSAAFGWPERGLWKQG